MKVKCKIGFHNWLVQNAHDSYEGLVGQAKVCCDCGKTTKWGKAFIPKEFKNYMQRKREREGVNEV